MKQRRWVAPLVVALVAAIVGAGTVILFVDPGSAAGASVVLEPAASAGVDPFTRSVTNDDEVPESIVSVTRTVAADLPSDTTTGGLTAAGNAPGLYGGTGNTGLCDPRQLSDYLTHTPDKAAAWGATLGVAPRAIPAYIATLTPVVLTTDTRVTNHGYADGHATPRQAILQAGTAVLVDHFGIPRAKCGCGNPLTEPASQPIDNTTGIPWTGYQPRTVTTITPTPTRQATFTLTNINTGTTYTQPTGARGEAAPGTLLAASYDDIGSSSLQMSTDGGRSWTAEPPTASGVEGDGVQLAYGGGRWLAVGSAHQGGLGYASLIGSSTDGRTWTPPAELPDALVDAAYGDHGWIAVGGSFDQSGTAAPKGVMYGSTDGQHWKVEPSSGLPTSTELDQWTWQSIAFGGGTWAALASECSHALASGILHCQSALYRSNDGHRWTDSGTRFAGYALIRFGGGSWIVTGAGLTWTTGDQLKIATSRDLSTWLPATVPTPTGPDPEHGPRPVVVFAGDAWLLAANQDFYSGPAQFFASSNARTWTGVGSVTEGINSLAYGGVAADTGSRR